MLRLRAKLRSRFTATLPRTLAFALLRTVAFAPLLRTIELLRTVALLRTRGVDTYVRCRTGALEMERSIGRALVTGRDIAGAADCVDGALPRARTLTDPPLPWFLSSPRAIVASARPLMHIEHISFFIYSLHQRSTRGGVGLLNDVKQLLT